MSNEIPTSPSNTPLSCETMHHLIVSGQLLQMILNRASDLLALEHEPERCLLLQQMTTKLASAYEDLRRIARNADKETMT